MNDMAFSTLNGYRKILDAVWRPGIGAVPFEAVVYSRLQSIAAAHAGITSDQIRIAVDRSSSAVTEPKRKAAKENQEDL